MKIVKYQRLLRELFLILVIVFGNGIVRKVCSIIAFGKEVMWSLWFVLMSVCMQNNSKVEDRFRNFEIFWF